MRSKLLGFFGARNITARKPLQLLSMNIKMVPVTLTCIKQSLLISYFWLILYQLFKSLALHVEFMPEKGIATEETSLNSFPLVTCS